jgi:hypothetical protein
MSDAFQTGGGATSDVYVGRVNTEGARVLD